jgi:hypothetical protein
MPPQPSDKVVSFEDADQVTITRPVQQNVAPPSSIEKLFLKTGLTESREDASGYLFLVAIVLFILSFIIIALTVAFI